jgi:hypothetical protein
MIRFCLLVVGIYEEFIQVSMGIFCQRGFEAFLICLTYVLSSYTSTTKEQCLNNSVMIKKGCANSSDSVSYNVLVNDIF